ncbi:hypothetical protein BDV93DRAFT_425815, partial [Ceratobasidium sp. AG-I]
ALNALPHFQPALTSSYVKIAGKSFAHTLVILNKQGIHNLTWFAECLRASKGSSLIRGNS